MSDQPPPSDPDPWAGEPDPWSTEPEPWGAEQPSTQPVPTTPIAPQHRPDLPTQRQPPVIPPPAAVHTPLAPTTTPVLAMRKRGWPESAKTTVAILVVLVMAGIIGTVVGFLRAADAEDQAADVPEDIATALERVEEVEEQLAESEQSSQAEINRLTTERDEALAALAEVEPGEGGEDLTEQLAAAEEEIALLTAQLAGFEETFPVELRPDLPSTNIDGQYAVTLTEVRCFNLDRCGTPPALPNVTVQRTSDQLVLAVPGQFQMALTGRTGQLFGVSLDDSVAPPCGDVARVQTTRFAIHAGATDIALDGTVTLRGLGASMLVTVDEVDDCPAGEAWYGVTLNKIG